MATIKIITEIKYIRETLEGRHWTEFIIIIPFVVIALICLIIENGFVYSYLWNWYISPITNFSSINIMQGVGLYFFIYALKNNNNNEEDINRTLRAFLMFITPLDYFAVAWLFHLFII